KLLSERLGLVHIGTGDILREAVRLGTPHGREVQPYVESGRLVPDDLVNELVADLFRQEPRPECFVLDGYPRTLAQAASFDQILRQQFLDIQAVIHFQVDDEEIVRRLSGRWICPKCGATYKVAKRARRKPGFCDECGPALIQREDDQEATIRRRLALYHKSTAELIEHYRRTGLVREVKGEGEIEEIYQRILRAARS